MKTVLFVPGFQEDLSSRDYASVLTAIRQLGYRVQFVPITWYRTTIVDWAKELDAVYASHDPADTILAGFSYGAMTAFLSATRRTPSQLWLFSLSPYFAEDVTSPLMKRSWLNEIGHRRVSTFSELHFAKLAPHVQCPVHLFIGQTEITKWPIMGERANAAHTLLPTSTLTIVEGVAHDVTHPHYIAAIERTIQSA